MDKIVAYSYHDKVMGQFIEILTEKTKQLQNAVQPPMPAVEAVETDLL